MKIKYNWITFSLGFKVKNEPLSKDKRKYPYYWVKKYKLNIKNLADFYDFILKKQIEEIQKQFSESIFTETALLNYLKKHKKK
mgnify:CR=1 FL=1